jgi:hypothetical protein
MYETVKHFSIYVLCYRSITFYTLSMPFNKGNKDANKWIRSGKGHIEVARGKAGNGGYVPTRLSVCPWALLIVTANAILIGNRLMHSLKEMAGSDGRSWILGIRVLLVEAITSVVMKCSCKRLTIMCCHHRRPREANKFHILSIPSGRGSTISFFYETILWEAINEIATHGSFLIMSILKTHAL